MGFFAFSIAGGGFILIGVWEALTSLNSNSNPNHSAPLNAIQAPTQFSASRANTASSSSSLSFIFVCVLSFLVIVNSLVSFFDAVNSIDPVGSAVQLPILATASLFLLYSIIGLSAKFKKPAYLPSSILNIIALFAFVEEFLLFYLQRKDTSGIENRYFDLLLFPITICILSTIIELKSQKSNSPKLVRGIGIILQGTWFLQMGLSFFTNMMTNGCFLHQKSRGNYTIKCKGHSEYHRARAIATLQFNCHLALLVVLVVGIYSIMSRRGGVRDFTRYRPIGAEMQPFENQGQFTLDSDDDNGDEINEENNLVKPKKDVGEESDGGNHGKHGNGKTENPTESILYIRHDSDAKEAAGADTEIPPLEEQALVGFVV